MRTNEVLQKKETEIEIDMKEDFAAWKLVSSITVSIVGFLLLGLWVDKLTGRKQLFLIIGFIVGLIIAIYELYKILSPLIKSEKK